MAENAHQQQVIESLGARIDHVEDLLKAWQEEQRARERQRAWGGFFGPRGVSAAS